MGDVMTDVTTMSADRTRTTTDTMILVGTTKGLFTLRSGDDRGSFALMAAAATALAYAQRPTACSSPQPDSVAPRVRSIASTPSAPLATWRTLSVDAHW